MFLIQLGNSGVTSFVKTKAKRKEKKEKKKSKQNFGIALRLPHQTTTLNVKKACTFLTSGLTITCMPF